MPGADRDRVGTSRMGVTVTETMLDTALDPFDPATVPQ
jgi:hypothetical protein